MDKSKSLGSHVVIAGGSMAGLIVAASLRPYFQKVTILDRDQLTLSPEPRKGSPQGRHIHVLLEAGRDRLEKLFPGMFNSLKESGATVDDSASMAWYFNGVWKLRGRSGMTFFSQSRPYLEYEARKRVLEMEDVTIRSGCEVRSVKLESDRVTGVVVRGPEDQISEESCDLFVDCTGRGTHLPRMLQEFGYDEPKETHVKIDIGYTTRIYRSIKDKDPEWSSMLIYDKAPKGRIGYIFPIEPDEHGKRWIVTMAGYFGEHAPLNDEGFVDFASKLARPDIHEQIKDGEPLTGFSAYKFPSNRMVRYDKYRKLPDGFVAVGDSLCSFNPIFGQGMSSAAMSAEVLTKLLRRKGLRGITRRYFKKVKPVLDVIWMITTGEDFRYERTVGKRPFGVSVLNWYTGKVNEVTRYDMFTMRNFLQVLHLVKPPTALFHPYIVYQVIKSALGFGSRSIEESQEYLRLRSDAEGGEGSARGKLRAVA